MQPYPNGQPFPNGQPYSNGQPFPNAQPYANTQTYMNSQQYANALPQQQYQPQQPTAQPYSGVQAYPQYSQNLSNSFAQMGIGGMYASPPRYIDLLQERNLLTVGTNENTITLPSTVANPTEHCSPDVFRCTMSGIPQTQELLKKCRFPLGLTLQPFRDLKQLNVLQTPTIVRCRKMLYESLDSLPGDDRMLIGFVAVDSAVHFYEFTTADGPVRELIVDDVDDMFLPVNSGLYVPLKQYRTAVEEFILNLPSLFEDNHSSSNCLGSALTIVRNLIAEIGGRVTVMQASLPNLGPGKLASREDPNQRAAADVKNLGPATDFYKSFALECTGNQIAVDLFLLNSQYNDLSTLSGMSKFSSGSIYHFPNYHMNRNQPEVLRYNHLLQRYLTRKIGFEAVLRIRCSRGVSLHSFYGNFFIRSTDLLALANVNPEAAIGVQVQLDDSLEGTNCVCFQAALLYTSSRGDRRIRVHTLCLPVISEFSHLFSAFDVKSTVSLLAKMASDRVMSGNVLSDSREALINAAVDALGCYNRSVGQSGNAVLAPLGQLRLLPLYILGLLKHSAFVAGGRSVKLDSRVAAMVMLKNAPLEVILLEIYPALYPVHYFTDSEEPQQLALTYEKISRDGVYVMDAGTFVYLYVGSGVNPTVLNDIFGVDHFARISEDDSLECRDNVLSQRLHEFIRSLERHRGVYAPVIIIREDSPLRETFTRRLVEDRTESSHSYIEFLHHIKNELSR
ncbi:hypothetical protein QR680_002395 [Steinernema hermaphroditum]|uniref:Sec23/Sec24 trunk domain-containing protein n=1 Tax=Steinernema hermaphroditum TaxID=289476 RepID=A0AA39H2J5_9BILA|nr:hypothetical protein QR680_002395 [Steinernema hermaphroditum]